MLFTIPQTKYFIKYRLLGIKDRVFLLHVGQLNLLMDKIDKKSKVVILGYLVKDTYDYYIVPDENMAKIKPLQQAERVVLLTDKNNKLVDQINSKCVNRYVKARGKIDKMIAFTTLKIHSVISIEKDKETVVCPIKTN